MGVPVPAVPSWLLEPLWDQFAALLPGRPAYDPAHPLGCHRRRIADRIVFEKQLQGSDTLAPTGSASGTVSRSASGCPAVSAPAGSTSVSVAASSSGPATGTLLVSAASARSPATSGPPRSNSAAVPAI